MVLKTLSWRFKVKVRATGPVTSVRQADHGLFSASQLSNANHDCEIERKLSSGLRAVRTHPCCGATIVSQRSACTTKLYFRNSSTYLMHTSLMHTSPPDRHKNA